MILDSALLFWATLYNYKDCDFVWNFIYLFIHLLLFFIILIFNQGIPLVAQKLQR